MFGVCCLLCVARCWRSLFVVRGVPFVAYCSVFGVCMWLRVVRCALFVVCCLLLAVAICCELCVVCCVLFVVFYFCGLGFVVLNSLLDVCFSLFFFPVLSYIDILCLCVVIMFVGCCCLFVACCSFRVAGCSLCVVSRLLFNVRYVLHVDACFEF